MAKRLEALDKYLYSGHPYFGCNEDLRKFNRDLILALASNPVLFQNQDGTPFVSNDLEKIIARRIERQADAITERLEKIEVDEDGADES